MIRAAVFSDTHLNTARMVEAVRQELNFTSLKYQRLDDMLASTGVSPCKLCTYCWNGRE